MKYKKGDRVRCVSDTWENFPRGMVGTVVGAGEKMAAVKTDEYHKNLHDLCGKCRDGYGYYLYLEDLELIKKKLKVTKEAYEALKASVSHWEDIEIEICDKIHSGDIPELHNADSCPCCKKYSTGKNAPDKCKLCPVYQKTNDTFCGETPWHTYNQSWINSHEATGELLDKAHAMTVWLKDLLDECQVEESITYEVGQRFRINSLGADYILARHMGEMVSLVNLETGWLATDPICVKRHRKITQSEMGSLVSGHAFTLIENKK